MKEIKKYKKTKKFFKIILTFLTLFSLAFLMITFTRNDYFDSTDIISLSFFSIVIVLEIIGLCIFDNKGKTLIAKYFGIPSEGDVMKAKEFLKVCKNLFKGAEYQFLADSEFENIEEQVEGLIYRLSRRQKLSSESVVCLEEIIRELNNCNQVEKELDLRFKNFIFELDTLFKNNSYNCKL